MSILLILLVPLKSCTKFKFNVFYALITFKLVTFAIFDSSQLSIPALTFAILMSL